MKCPINYFSLSEPERNAVLSRFQSALQQLSLEVVFCVKLGAMSFGDGTNSTPRTTGVTPSRAIIPRGELLGTISLQERCVRLMEVPAYPVASNFQRYVVLENGDLAKAYTTTDVSSDLEIVFTARDMNRGSIIGKTDEVRLRIEPLRGGESKGVARLHALLAAACTQRPEPTSLEVGYRRARDSTWNRTRLIDCQGFNTMRMVINGIQRL